MKPCPGNPNLMELNCSECGKPMITNIESIIKTQMCQECQDYHILVVCP